MASGSRTGFVPARFRAAKACLLCRQKRVKCDAMDHGTPCTRCVSSGRTDCVLFESKRGTYKRRQRIDMEKQAHESPRPDLDGQSSEIVSTSYAAGAALVESAQHRPDSSPSSNRSRTTSEHATRPEEQFQAEQPSAAPASIGASETTTANAARANEFAALPNVPENSDLRTRLSLDCSSPVSCLSNTTLSPYPDVSWASTFDPFLKTRKSPPDDRSNRFSITYLDESFPLSLVLQDQGHGTKPQLHYLTPAKPEPPGHPPSSDHHHPAHVPPKDIEFLQTRGCFELPNPEILDMLLNTFLDRVYPLYPIFKRRSFLESYRAQQLPWLLLHSVCFAAVTFCEEDVLFRAGYQNRIEARLSYYRKAKALFDLGYHMNKIMVLQSVILLSFWGGAHNSYWNSASWIGAGVIIAESLGIHRSMADTRLAPEDRSLLRRLWWILFVRDTGAATFSGRQFRMNSVDVADVESLTCEDFVADSQEGEDGVRHRLDGTIGPFHVENTKLFGILRRIVLCKRTGHGARHDEMYHDLRRWRAELPPALNWRDSEVKLDLLPASLALAYNHNLILANLGGKLQQSTNSVHSDPRGRQLDAVCENAAHRIFDLTCGMTTKSTFPRLPHEAFHALFLAQAVFYSQTLATDTTAAKMGRMAVNTCQVVWHNVRGGWDPARWVMKLFENLLVATPPRRSEDMHMVIDDAPGHPVDYLSDMPVNDFDGMNSLLSSIFDMSTAMDGLTDPTGQEMFSFSLANDNSW
ncbi:uncharacterized protein PV07_06144 [Cladophialophora immunda]|uniref:Zn(2)-C6 fungal-type domain-containing protein n=1 Tax=Cladophialophora immunda TaxID=569365 RepID=A0A0D2D3W7_9EURO|nr:uncharacterized protein PV07_06144 [Cladophialophora immunda]KIW30399.1 hypothetical protein PV07_06144 [Cladophialophora immunda]OQV04684.1 Fungal specific transcription factor domain-containing protein [Cladophialophora immunda]